MSPSFEDSYPCEPALASGDGLETPSGDAAAAAAEIAGTDADEQKAVESQETEAAPTGIDPEVAGLPGEPAIDSGSEADEAPSRPHLPRRRSEYPKVNRTHLDECKTFVACSDFIRFRDSFGAPNGAIYGIFGHHGQDTTALNLAKQLRPDVLAESADFDNGPEIRWFYRRPSDPLKFHQRLEKLGQNKVLIVREGAESIFHELPGIAGSYILEERGIDLILVAERRPEISSFKATWIDASLDPSQLLEVFSAHYDQLAGHGWNDVLRSRLLDEAKKAGILDSPGQIVDFLRSFADRWSPGAEAQLAQEVANEIVRSRRAKYRYPFSRLSPTHRLAALILGLFEGIQHEILFSLIEIAAFKLRENGAPQFRDLRGLSFDDLRDRLQASENGDGSVIFASAQFRREVHIQVSRNGPLLWGVSEDLIAVLLSGETDRSTCQLVGNALTLLATSNRQLFFRQIESLAGSNQLPRQLAAAIALENLAFQSPESQPEILGLIDHWIDGKHPAFLAAALLTSWRWLEAIGRNSKALPFEATLRHCLLKLAHASRQEHLLQLTMILVLLQSMADHPKPTAEMLCVWLKAGAGDFSHQIARFALANLFIRFQADSAAPELPVINAVIALGSTIFTIPDSGPLEDSFLDVLVFWLRHRGATSSHLRNSLIDLSLSKNHESRVRLLAALTRCTFKQQPDLPEIDSLLRDVSGHLLALLGVPLPSRPLEALLALDMGFMARTERLGERFGRVARLLFGSSCRLETLHLGVCASTPAGDAIPGARILLRRPRLLLPPLEGLPAKPDAIFMVNLEPILDLDDRLDLELTRGIHFVSILPTPRQTSDSLFVLAFDPTPDFGSLFSFLFVIDRLIQICTTILRDEPSRHWPEKAELALSAYEHLEPAAFIKKILTCAAQDLRGGIDLVIGLMESERGGKSFQLYASGALAVLNWTAVQGPAILSGEGLVAAVERLARRLIAFGWPGTHAVLRALRSWLSDEACRSLFAGDLKTPRYLELFRDLPQDQFRALDSTLGQWLADLAPDESDQATGLRKLYESLIRRARIAVAPRMAPLSEPATLVVVSFASNRLEWILSAPVKTLARNFPSSFVYLAGRSTPILIHRRGELTENPDRSRLHPWPRLIGPILEEYEPEQIAKVLLISDLVELDLDDLRVSWSGHLFYRTPSEFFSANRREDSAPSFDEAAWTPLPRIDTSIHK